MKTFIFIVAVTIISGITFKIWPVEPEPQISAWDATNCLIGIVGIDNSINFHESNAGKYSYVLIPRTDGQIEIWRNTPCSETEQLRKNNYNE